MMNCFQIQNIVLIPILIQDAELNGRTVKQNPEWNRHHNYKGVYDMILYKVFHLKLIKIRLPPQILFTI